MKLFFWLKLVCVLTVVAAQALDFALGGVPNWHGVIVVFLNGFLAYSVLEDAADAYTFRKKEPVGRRLRRFRIDAMKSLSSDQLNELANITSEAEVLDSKVSVAFDRIKRPIE